MKYLLAFTVLQLILFQSNLKAQYTQAFDFVNLPHSVSSLGTGWQGVASLSNDDALTYNPAKLSLTKNTKISFFRNPFQLIGSFPLINFSIYHKANNIGTFGISYENWDYGEVTVTTPENPEGVGEKFHYYERSFSAGYARNLTNNLSGGIQFRYSYANTYESSPGGFFISFGFQYNPECLQKKLMLGFSLMNLGPAVKTEINDFVRGKQTYYDPPPTKLNLGINFIAAENDYFSLPLNLSISKPFDERDDKGDGQSSFKTLFTDWSDFPNDVSLHTGISFIWKSLRLSENFSFFQEFYFGNYSDGIKSGITNFYNHGANIGIEFYEYKFSMGYAGVSHNAHYPNYFTWRFPYETFQFALELNDNLLFKKNNPVETKSLLESIILSFALGHTARLGIAQGYEQYGYKVTYDNNISYSFESAFYFNKKNALVSSLTYNSIPYDISYGSLKFIDTKIETFSFFSSYRYHPLEQFWNLFIQGGMGIYRLNPVQKSEPRYDYKTAVQFSTGLMLDVLEPVVVTPFVDYNLFLFPATGSAPRIQGHNQLNFGLKIGYKFI